MINVAGQSYYFLNTCPFDSLFEILVDIYDSSALFRNYVRNNRGEIKILHHYKTIFTVVTKKMYFIKIGGKF